MRMKHFLLETSVRNYAMTTFRHALILVIDNWNRGSHPMQKNAFGVFEITIPSNNGQPAIPHNSKIKVCQQNQHLQHLRLT